mmetsp:Transcript_1552/g.3427  ORF Transcript_1552/g.3427 Transcript_1552/m.3427 type:complete len:105 (+) Transcript_1552:786-1100(+)
MYDTCRGDIHKLENTKKAKREEIVSLGGSVTDATTSPSEDAVDGTSNNNFVPPQSTFSDNTALSAATSTNNNNDAFSDFAPPPPASSSQQTQSQSQNGPMDFLL